MSRPSCDIDLEAAEFVLDPYPQLAAQRRARPIGWHEASRTWMVVAHEHCNAVLRDRRFGRVWHDRTPVERFEPFNLLHRNHMMENEPPNHSRLRRQVSTAFARGHIERMRPRVSALGREPLGEVGGEQFDVLADFAEPLPVLVISEPLGAPRADAARFRRWAQAIVKMYEPTVTPDVEEAALAASATFADYIRALMARRRHQLRDDLLSDLLRAQDGADGLSDHEVLKSAVLRLNAGHQASVNVFGSGLAALLAAPHQWARLELADSPERRPTFVLRGYRALFVAGGRAGVPR